jgi:two-component system cell cycle sensor histidine kinase PleC
MLGFAELLENGALAEPQRREYARYIRESGEHLIRVLDRILDLARIDSGKLELRREAGIDPRRLSEECLRLVAERAKAAGLHLSLEVAADAPLLVADRTRLAEILLNLLSNAIEFTAPGGEIALVVRGGVGGAGFEVHDTGIGMTADEIAAALEPFGRNSGGRDRHRPSFGLGLPLVRRFVELHGGSLHIASEKGAGTRAAVVLPASCVLTADGNDGSA